MRSEAAPLQLAPVKAYRDRWTAPFEKNPFDVPLAEKLEMLRAAAREIKAGKARVLGFGFPRFPLRGQVLRLERRVVDSAAHHPDRTDRFVPSRSTPTPVSRRRATGLRRRSRSATSICSRSTSWRTAAAFARRWSSTWRRRRSNPARKDLLLLPSHLWLTIHESIGHSTELDRALGYEANFAGTSFLTARQARQAARRQRHRQHLRRPHHAEGALDCRL